MQRKSLLTKEQLACLELVAENLTSKEIAARLGISRHTVDERMRCAIRALGAPNRRQAARLLQTRSRNWQRPDQHRSNHVPVGTLEDAHADSCPGYDLSDIPLPFATERRPINEMSVAMRLVWIVGIAAAAFIGGITYLAGLESLGRLLKP